MGLLLLLLLPLPLLAVLSFNNRAARQTAKPASAKVAFQKTRPSLPPKRRPRLPLPLPAIPISFYLVPLSGSLPFPSMPTATRHSPSSSFGWFTAPPWNTRGSADGQRTARASRSIPKNTILYRSSRGISSVRNTMAT